MIFDSAWSTRIAEPYIQGCDSVFIFLRLVPIFGTYRLWLILDENDDFFDQERPWTGDIRTGRGCFDLFRHRSLHILRLTYLKHGFITRGGGTCVLWGTTRSVKNVQQITLLYVKIAPVNFTLTIGKLNKSMIGCYDIIMSRSLRPKLRACRSRFVCDVVFENIKWNWNQSNKQ